MRKILSGELKQIQLDMLKDIDSFCSENNISYFLAYGTLLGAVRHKGYIPWDDDIDICLPRPDYERFISLYKNVERNYQVVEFRKTKGYALPFAKVSNENTVMNEYLYDKDVFGVYIDVFPIDGYGKKIQITLSQWLNKFLNAKKAVLGRNRSLAKNILIAIGKIALSPFSVKMILNKMHHIATAFDYSKSLQTEIFCSSTVEREIVPKFVFKKLIKSEFENLKVNIPAEFDKYLTALFGDYMTFPPKEKQISHHSFEAWWKD
jgi:lipopolysaccharide cholinephosphotransferase